MLSSIEVTAVILHSCVAISSISINLLLLVIVCRHTPKSFSTFAIMLKFHVFADLVITLGGSATMTRIIPIDWALAAFFYGPCGHFGLKACHMAIALALGGIEVALCSVLAALIFRLLVIRGRMPTARQARMLICSISLPMPSVLITAYCNLSYDTAAIRNLVNKVHPEYDANSHVVEGHIDIRSDSFIVIVFLLVVAFWILYIFMIIIRSRILNAIDQCSLKMSDKSKRMQRKLVAMLTTQATLPVIPSIAIISYFLGFFNIIHHPILEFMAFLLVDTTSILSPLVALSYIDHYRKLKPKKHSRPKHQEHPIRMSLTRQISEPCVSLEAKYDVPPAQLTVQGLSVNRSNYIKRQLHRNMANSSHQNTVTSQSKNERQPPENYMRYLSNLSTVTINNGREFRNVPEYLRQFEMSRRGTPTSTITARRRTREGDLPPDPSSISPPKLQSKCRKALSVVLSKHRIVGLRHIALSLVLIAFWLAGMVIFYSIEGPNERESVEETRHALNEALILLGRNLSVDPFLLKEAYLTLMKIDGKYAGSTFYKLEERNYPLWEWSYGTAFFFSYTLFTTIGYGNIAPSTDMGRAITIVYGTIGFPLAAIITRDVGSVILVYITRGYAKVVKKIRKAGAYSTDEPIMLTAPICTAICLAVTALTALFVMAYDSWLGPDPGLSYFLSFYWTFISYSSIGLGELMPNNFANPPVLAIWIIAWFPLMRVVNRVLYVGYENTVYRIVTWAEEGIDRFAGVETREEEERDEQIENCPTIEVDLCAVTEADNERDDDEDDRIRPDTTNNLTIRSASEIDSANKHR